MSKPFVDIATPDPNMSLVAFVQSRHLPRAPSIAARLPFRPRTNTLSAAEPTKKAPILPAVEAIHIGEQEPLAGSAPGHSPPDNVIRVTGGFHRRMVFVDSIPCSDIAFYTRRQQTILQDGRPVAIKRVEYLVGDAVRSLEGLAPGDETTNRLVSVLPARRSLGR